jgi:hypothetical protein
MTTAFRQTTPVPPSETIAGMNATADVALGVWKAPAGMVVSKYIGETEKNLAVVSDEHENIFWMFFFDDANTLLAPTKTGNSGILP